MDINIGSDKIILLAVNFIAIVSAFFLVKYKLDSVEKKQEESKEENKELVKNIHELSKSIMELKIAVNSLETELKYIQKK